MPAGPDCPVGPDHRGGRCVPSRGQRPARAPDRRGPSRRQARHLCVRRRQRPLPWHRCQHVLRPLRRLAAPGGHAWRSRPQGDGLVGPLPRLPSPGPDVDARPPGAACPPGVCAALDPEAPAQDPAAPLPRERVRGPGGRGRGLHAVRAGQQRLLRASHQGHLPGAPAGLGSVGARPVRDARGVALLQLPVGAHDDGQLWPLLPARE
mmetsp:Transcript_37662/g.117039  ORF Transcript_37662/g.117039 Transcript_37662/m.117039 type:complete len:207 (+) Transcript_37662:1290-1910(+)